MTTSTAIEVESRRRPAQRRPRTPFGALADVCERVAREEVGETWPSTRYQRDPERFFREVLGSEPWARQVDVINLVRDHRRVAVAAGHKVSKSHTAAGIALWFYCSFPDARVVMSSTTSRQVDQILWRELRMMRARAKRFIDGDMHELARSGLKAADFREVVGFTAREAEAVAGISGSNLLYILDEASGIDDDIFEAIAGNMAGGGRLLMFSNPTRTEGEFFEAMRGTKTGFYKTLTISSEESPNVSARDVVIPGLATHEWIEEKRLEWGSMDAEGNFIPGPLYKVRVLGEFVENEEGRILSLHLIQLAEERWDDPATEAEGRLFIGIDPAGPGLGGDESAYAVRRGKKILAIYTFRGLSDDAHVVNLLGILQTHRKPREQAPVVVIDREGPIGATVFGVLRGASERNGFEVAGIRSSERALRNKERFERVRDELWWNLFEWVRDGGAIPEDGKLAKELHAPQWENTVNGKAKATGKSELRKALERSPDRADAVALAVWSPSTYAATVAASAAAPAQHTYHGHAAPLSPYQAQNAFRPRRPR